MMNISKQEPMTAAEKKRDLCLRQKELPVIFLEHGAINQAQNEENR